MADPVNLADEFSLPEKAASPGADAQTATSNQSVDLMSEFEPPSKEHRYAIINESADKEHEWNMAFKGGTPEEQTLRSQSLLEQWIGRARFDIHRAIGAVEESPGTAAALEPTVNLPRMEESPNIPALGIGNPHLVSGVYNGLAPIISSFTSPLSIGSAGIFGGLMKAAQGVGPAAQAASKALTAMKVYFGATMAKGAGEAAGKASVEPSVENVTSAVAQGLLAAGVGVSAVADVAAPTKTTTGEASHAIQKQEAASEVLRPEVPRPSEGVGLQGVEQQNKPAQPATEGAKGNEGGAQEVASAAPIPLPSDAQVTVMRMGEKESVQIDVPGEKGARPVASGSPEELRRQGYDVPELPADLPEGQHRIEDLVKPDLTEEFNLPEKMDLPQEIPTATAPLREHITSIKNAVVDEERTARGLAPAMEAAKRSFGTVWDDAMKRLDQQPSAAADLVEEINRKPRALTDTEDAMLLHRQVTLQNNFDRLTDRINESAGGEKSPTAMSDQADLARTSDELISLYNAGRLAGTESGRGLNARRMLAAEDYSLARMETTRRAANEGKPLTEKQAAENQALHDEIAATRKAFDDYVAKQNAAKPTTATTNRARNVVARYISEQADAARERIKARYAEGRVQSGLDPADLADHAIIGADYLSRGVEKFSDWSAEMVKELGERIRPHLQTIFDAAKARQTEIEARKDQISRLKSYKTRTATRTEELEAKTEAGDFSAKPKPAPLVMDEEALRLKERNMRAEMAFQEALIKDRYAHRTPLETLRDWAVKWRRGFLLSGIGTLEKLTGAAVARLGITPAEEAVGAALGKIPGISEVAAKAPRQGGFNSEAEAKALTAAVMQGLKDSVDILKSGKSQLDVLFGKGKDGALRESDVLPRSFIDLFGQIHGAMKAPVKRAEYARSLEKRLTYAIRNGVDVSDPGVQTRLMVEAYKDANRSIFLQDNIVVDAWNAGIARMQAIDKATGKSKPAGVVGATVAKVLLPIVRVPTNIVAETVEYATGSVTGSARLALALRRGVENLPEEQADLIMRQLKKGSLGAAALLIGYFNYKAVGGFYQSGEKRKASDAKVGSVKVLDTELESHLLHHPVLESLQIGATVHRVQEEKVRKGDQEAFGEGVWAAALGLTEEVPFAREAVEASKILQGGSEGQYARGELAKSFVVPAASESVARQLDKKTPFSPFEDTTKRKAKTLGEHVQSGIPLLREELPVRH